jgi:hypothetical protein
MTEEPDKPKKGFAGLSSMVSVVDVPEPQKKSPKTSEEDNSLPKRGSPFEINMPPMAPALPFWSKSWFKWTLGIFILIIILSVLSRKNDTPLSYTPSGSSGFAAYNPPTLEELPPIGNALTPPLEELPPIGSGLTLTNNQIRYCLSEKIRIEAWETVLNTHSDLSVNSFNDSVDNFNMRCSNYRYKKYEMDLVSSQVEARRLELRADGFRNAALYSGN